MKADRSQIELRIAAKVAREKRTLVAYKSGEDLHALTAKALLGKAAVTTAARRLAEAVNFGPLYGQGADGRKRALALPWKRRGQSPCASPVLGVHDEVVVECDADKVEGAAVWLRGAMRDGTAPLVSPVPGEVELAAGPTQAG